MAAWTRRTCARVCGSSRAGRSCEDLRGSPLRIVSLSRVSNVTGLTTPMSAINVLVHEEGALVCWDCATAGTHEAPPMNNTSVNPLDYADALFFSPHKMVGGVGAPGLLILKKKLLLNETPNLPGGGTIFLVSEGLHRYTQLLTEREEGGTPNIVGAIRFGLALHLHNTLGWDWIREREQRYLAETLAVLRRHRNIVVLGDDNDRPKAALFSFLVKFHGWDSSLALMQTLPPLELRPYAAQRPLRHPDALRLHVRRPLLHAVPSLRLCNT